MMQLKAQAKAVYDLYKALPQQVQNEVRKLIAETESDKMSVKGLSDMANDSFSEIWDSPENEHWDEFLNKQVNV